MAQRKPYNPNTKYGRRKLREQAQEEFSKLPQHEQDSTRMLGCFIGLLLALVIGGCLYITKGPAAALKWLSH